MPTVAQYMTMQPWTIRSDATLEQARALMREHGIRHLPVLDAGKLVGILSERDVLTSGAAGDGAAETLVESAMTVEVYTAHCDDALDEVLDEMGEHKYGSVVVRDRRDHVTGIFTAVDALQFFAEILRRQTC